MWRSVPRLIIYALVLLLFGGTPVAFPTSPLAVVVTIAFDGSTPVDVSAYVSHPAGIDRSMGRTATGSSADPGRVRLVLDAPRGRPGLFNPFDASETYWQVGGWEGVPVAITVEGEAWFAGRVERLTPYWDQDGDGHLAVEATGPLSYALHNGAVRGSLTRAVLGDGPRSYWPMADATLATRLSADIGPSMMLSGALDLGALAGPPGAPGDYPQAMAADASSYLGTGSVTLPAGGSSAGWTVELITNATTSATVVGQSFVSLASWRTNGGATIWELGVFKFPGDPVANGLVSLYVWNADRSWSWWGGIATVVNYFDAWWHLSVSATQDGADTDIIITAQRGATAYTAMETFAARTCGMITALHWPSATSYWAANDTPTMHVGHIAVHDGIPAGLSDRGQVVLGWAGELAADRATRLCAEAGVSLTVDAGTSTAMGEQPDASLLDLLLECEQADQGRLTETVGGSLRYTPRTARYNVAPTLTLAPSDLASTPMPESDATRRLSEVILSSPGRDSVVVSDPGAPANAGTLQQTVNIHLGGALDDLAAWLLVTANDSRARIAALALDLADNAGSLVAGWLAAIATAPVRITISGWSGAPDGLDVMLEGWSETLQLDSWTARLNVSTMRPYDVAVLESGDAHTWRLDCAGQTLAVPAAVGTDTAYYLLTAPGYRAFTTSAEYAADFPVDLDVAGARVTCTAAASTPAYVAAGAAAHADNTPVTPGLPAGIARGDLLLIFAAIRNSGTGTVDTPAGWTQITASGNVALLGRYYDAGVVAPEVTFTGGAAGATTSAQMCAFRNVSMGLGRPAVWSLNGSAQDIAVPALAPSPGYPQVTLRLGWKQDDWTSVAALAGYTEIGEPDSTDGDDQGLVWDYLVDATGVAVAAATFSVTGGGAAISRGGTVGLYASVQTLTCTAAAVNGVAKTVPLGTAITCWRLPALAL